MASSTSSGATRWRCSEIAVPRELRSSSAASRGGFLLGKSRGRGGKSRIEGFQILALRLRLRAGARKLALLRAQEFCLGKLRGLERRDARIAFDDACGECGDCVVEEGRIALHFADLLVAPRKRSAQIAHLFVESRDARGARTELGLQLGDFLSSVAELALQAVQPRFAVVYGMVEPGNERIEDSTPTLERAQRLQIAGVAHLQFAHVLLRRFDCSFALSKFGIERAFARVQSTRCGIAFLHCKAPLLAARLGLRERRLHLRELLQQRAGALLGRNARAARGSKLVLKFRETLAFARQARFDVLQ